MSSNRFLKLSASLLTLLGVICLEPVGAQKLVFVDSLVFGQAKQSQFGTSSLDGDTFSTFDFDKGLEVWHQGKLVMAKKVKEPRRDRGCGSSNLTLRRDYVFNSLAGHLINIKEAKPQYCDLWKKREGKFISASNMSQTYRANGGIFTSLNGSSDMDFEHSNYYQDSCLVQVDANNCTIRKMGQKPAFLRVKRDRQPVSQYMPSSLQDLDTVFVSFSGWPLIYKYVNGHLQDSTSTANGFPEQFVYAPIYFSQAEVEKTSPYVPDRMVYNHWLEDGGPQILDGYIVRFLRNKSNNYMALYDRSCRYVRTVEVPSIKGFGGCGVDLSSGLVTYSKHTSTGTVFRRYRVDWTDKGI